MPLMNRNGAAALKPGLRLKREYGEAYPKGTETVAAPATVSGEWACIMPLATSREGAGQQRPASQETCHFKGQPQRTGCSDGREKVFRPPQGVAFFRYIMRLSAGLTLDSRRDALNFGLLAPSICMSCSGHGASLEVRGLGYSPGGIEPLIDGIGFRLDPGDRLAIVGPNGAGKTTLLRCLYRALKPGRGSVLLDGCDIWSLDPRDLARRVAVVLQEMPADFAFTVEDIVTMGRIPWRRSGWLPAMGRRSPCAATEKAAVWHAMEHLNVTELAKRGFATLSGGEKQRVLIARALAQDPQILILDEPSNHLDIRHQLEILDLLRGLGITVITTLHDINLAAGFATRALLLHGGRAIAEGRPDDVLTEANLSAAFSVKARIHATENGRAPNFSFALRA